MFREWTEDERAEAVRDAVMWQTVPPTADHFVGIMIAGVEFEVGIDAGGVPCVNVKTKCAREGVHVATGARFTVDGLPSLPLPVGPRSPKREELYRSILTTAFESGIDYWVAEFADVVRSDEHDVLSVRVRPDEEEDWLTVTVDDIERGWWMFQRMYRAGKHNGWGSHRNSLIDCGEHLDELDIDSVVADDVFQLAALGEIVYA